MLQEKRSFLFFISLLSSLFCYLFSHQSWGAEVLLRAEVDQARVPLDQSINLKITVEVPGSISDLQEPSFKASDFKVLDRFESSFFQSITENDQTVLKNTRQFIYVLEPSRLGQFKISGLSVHVNGKSYTASDVAIEVVAAQGPSSGAARPKAQTPPNPSQGILGGFGGGFGTGFGGMGVAPEDFEDWNSGSTDSAKAKNMSPYFIRAEVNRDQVYKGEQLVVSYYLYRRIRVFNIEVTKYPDLKGFLREDLSMPILGRRLDVELVTVEGVPYRRSLLARYAAYPLQLGSLEVDPMQVKANYYPENQNQKTTDPLFQYFQLIMPRNFTEKSKPVPIRVIALPSEDRPKGFSGVVGDFQVTAALDQERVEVNKPFSLIVKVEGQGNVATLPKPDVQWPTGLEIFEVKTQGKTTSQGIAEKVFEYLIIPHAVGHFRLPILDFHFFDPKQKKYIQRTTPSFEVDVIGSPTGKDNAPSNAAPVSPTGSEVSPSSPPQEEQLRPFKDFHLNSEEKTKWMFQVFQGITVALVLLSLWLMISIGVRPLWNRLRAARNINRPFEVLDERLTQLLAQVKHASSKDPSPQSVKIYEELVHLLEELVSIRFKVSVRAQTREQLRQALLKHLARDQLPISLWDKMERVFETADRLKYSGNAAKTDAAVSDLGFSQIEKDVTETQELLNLLRK